MIPDGWKRVRLGDVTYESGDRNPGTFISEDLFGVFKGQGFRPMDDRVKGKGVDRCKVVGKKMFAYNPMRLNIGSIARNELDREIIVSPDYVVFAADQQIQVDYLNHLRHSDLWRSFVESAGTGSVRIRIYYKFLKEFDFLLPPLAEQKRIAEILGSVDEAIATTEAVIEQTKKVKQGLLQELLTKGIGHTKFKETKIGRIPLKWSVAKISEIAKVIDCKHRTPVYTDSGFAVVRPRDVKEGPIFLDNCLRTGLAEHKDLNEKTDPQVGDVVYSRNATFGVGALVETDQPFSIGQDVCLIRGGQISGVLLFYLLNSPVVRSQIDAISTGSTFKRINLKDIRGFQCPLIPIDEQNDLVKICRSLDAALYSQEAHLKTRITMRAGLMQDLLTGKVRV